MVKPIDLLTRQLSFFQTVMSIIAESVTLASMTPRRAWIMIFMSTVSPLAQNLLGKYVYHGITICLSILISRGYKRRKGESRL